VRTLCKFLVFIWTWFPIYYLFKISFAIAEIIDHKNAKSISLEYETDIARENKIQFKKFRIIIKNVPNIVNTIWSLLLELCNNVFQVFILLIYVVFMLRFPFLVF